MMAATIQAAMKARMGESPRLLALWRDYGSAAMAIKRSNAASLRCNTLRLGGIGGGVHVEEGVDRRRRPVANGDAMAGGPTFDLAHVLFDEGLAQVLPQRHLPQADNRMPPIAPAPAGQLQTAGLARRRGPRARTRDHYS